MTLSDTLKKFQHQTISHVVSATSYDAYGTVATSSTYTRAAIVQYSIKMIRDKEGNERVSTAQVYLSSTFTVSPNDKITLPDGTNPPIMSIGKTVDKDGITCQQVIYT